MRKTASNLGLATILFTGVAATAGAGTWTGWGDVELRRPLKADYRAQVVDVAPLGENRFVVSYYDEYNWLWYETHDADTGASAGPRWLAWSRIFGRNDWVRAMTGGPVVEQPTGFLMYGQSAPVLGTVNFFSIESGDDIFLIRHEYDTRFRVSAHQIAGTSGHRVMDTGGRPSVAWGKPTGAFNFFGNPGKALTVWGDESELRGRFSDINGRPLGGSFVILDLDRDLDPYTIPFIFSTDVIWNPVSESFIVGVVVRDNAQHCEFWNVRVKFDGTSDDSAAHPTPRRHGFCGHNIDSGTDGHHTSVAYTPNYLGEYAWWYIDEYVGSTGAKGVRLMDAYGEPRVDGDGNKIQLLQPPSTTNPYTDPVAGLPSAPWWGQAEYVFPQVVGSTPKRMIIKGLDTNSDSFSTAADVDPATTSNLPQVRALAALDDTTSVIVWTACPDRDCVVPGADVPGVTKPLYPSYVAVVEDGPSFPVLVKK
jgi:hypothetical protein